MRFGGDIWILVSIASPWSTVTEAVEMIPESSTVTVWIPIVIGVQYTFPFSWLKVPELTEKLVIGNVTKPENPKLSVR